ncbi:hypothetical protein Isop_3446 [Isosphaera pallida ATCC 43644]|uniref:Uncharacterized protein n=1 Tax=Isosphaera pallida (strain ATCC 43644 / DSM 9630 / IS1B) TaxID=575540 RepID=E8QWW4_ISOPI|nr:hypothetical protein Isop_3446 [Isosphaera pallida ATCC 43644]
MIARFGNRAGLPQRRGRPAGSGGTVLGSGNRSGSRSGSVELDQLTDRVEMIQQVAGTSRGILHRDGTHVDSQTVV